MLLALWEEESDGNNSPQSRAGASHGEAVIWAEKEQHSFSFGPLGAEKGYLAARSRGPARQSEEKGKGRQGARISSVSCSAGLC